MIKQFLLISLLALSLSAQVPTVQPQPVGPTYPPSALNLLPEYDRTSFQAVFGQQAPAYDPGRAPKDWFDSTQNCSDPNKMVTYNVMSSDLSNPGEVALTISACDASKINLKGFPTFPVFRTATQNVQIVSGIGQPVLLGPKVLATTDEAKALAAEIGGDVQAREALGPLSPDSPYKYTKVDPNNPYSLFLIGQQNVGLMLTQRNSKGVGYPGKWVKQSEGYYEFQFQSLTDGSADNKNYLPIPVRPILPNEAFDKEIAGIIPITVVRRTDTATQPSAGGSFSDTDRATLGQILQLLKQLLGQ